MTDSLLDEGSCRGKDALRIWECIQVKNLTVQQIADRINRGVTYTHGLLKQLQEENRVNIASARRVSDRSVEPRFECECCGAMITDADMRPRCPQCDLLRCETCYMGVGTVCGDCEEKQDD